MQIGSCFVKWASAQDLAVNVWGAAFVIIKHRLSAVSSDHHCNTRISCICSVLTYLCRFAWNQTSVWRQSGVQLGKYLYNGLIISSRYNDTWRLPPRQCSAPTLAFLFFPLSVLALCPSNDLGTAAVKNILNKNGPSGHGGELQQNQAKITILTTSCLLSILIKYLSYDSMMLICHKSSKFHQNWYSVATWVRKG